MESYYGLGEGTATQGECGSASTDRQLEPLRRFLFDPLEPGDIEAAAALAGVAAWELGDVLGIGDGGTHCLATPEAAVRLESALHHVRGVAVATQRLASVSDLAHLLPKDRELESVESSLRVDAVLAAGAAAWVARGHVCRNGLPVAKPSTVVEVGDELGLWGRGRLVLREARSTAKGRLRLRLDRYS
ncbi:hypothetical protein QBZ16_002307 [Prototheca wickerhamii]|uniref:RNA-binding S4 domain-containing protein n=1 Tax=Prototheca wickerhamii TaxID=3111 RepID=A0AAD9INR6_PROWI|nr:hypothetical protein QBZ16_002307 [Prototheca wickerhamii]